MNLEKHITNFRRAIGDMGLSESLVIDYLNAAVRDFAKPVKILKQFKGTRSWSAVEHQGKYALPATHSLVNSVVRYDDEPLRKWDKVDQELLGQSDRWTETEPERFAVFANHLELWPIPDSDAASTTLDGDVAIDATTITLDSVDDLPEQGRALIDSEVISWTYVDSDNVQLTGVERALEGTMPAAHSSGATFTLRNIVWTGGLLPKKFFARPARSAQLAVSANASACTDGNHRVWITYFSSKWQSESLPLEIDEVTTASQQIDISDIPASDEPDIDYIRIYMNTDDGTVKYYVATIANGTATYSITVNDTNLALAAVYTTTVSDVPWQYNDVIDDLAVAQWFFDSEQYERWRLRKMAAAEKMNELAFVLEGEVGGGYGFVGN